MIDNIVYSNIEGVGETDLSKRAISILQSMTVYGSDSIDLVKLRNYVGWDSWLDVSLHVYIPEARRDDYPPRINNMIWRIAEELKATGASIQTIDSLGYRNGHEGEFHIRMTTLGQPDYRTFKREYEVSKDFAPAGPRDSKPYNDILKEILPKAYLSWSSPREKITVLDCDTGVRPEIFIGDLAADVGVPISPEFVRSFINAINDFSPAYEVTRIEFYQEDDGVLTGVRLEMTDLELEKVLYREAWKGLIKTKLNNMLTNPPDSDKDKIKLLLKDYLEEEKKDGKI